MDLRSIGDIAGWPEGDLVRRLGKLGLELAQRAKGNDERPVEPEHEAKSISQETTFARVGQFLRRRAAPSTACGSGTDGARSSAAANLRNE